MDVADAAASAASIAELLDLIEAGEVAASEEERSRLEGALAALAEVVDPAP